MPLRAFNLKQMIAGGREGGEGMITLAEHQEYKKKKGRRRRRRKGPRANSSSAATINLPPKEIHNNEAGKSEDLWPGGTHTDQHLPRLLGSLPTRMALSHSYNDKLSLPTVLQVH